jgi:uncharacterized phiE125 gp8 family phage protein
MLTTLADIKSALAVAGTGDDTLLERMLNGADGYIEAVTGRDFAGGTFTELHAGHRAAVFLSNFPVSAITSLKVDPGRAFGSDTERAADTFVLHAARGVIESLTGPFVVGGGRAPSTVRVVYTTATSAVPHAVKEACAQLVSHWYRQVKTFNDQQYRMLVEHGDGTNSKAWPWSLASGLKVPAAVMQLLAPFRVPPV